MNGSILKAESNNSDTFSVLHQQIQGKILDKVVAVVPEQYMQYHFNPIRYNHILTIYMYRKKFQAPKNMLNLLLISIFR